MLYLELLCLANRCRPQCNSQHSLSVFEAGGLGPIHLSRSGGWVELSPHQIHSHQCHWSWLLPFCLPLNAGRTHGPAHTPRRGRLA